jgi:hypothetical protein
MRIAAGETIALLFELARDMDPVSAHLFFGLCGSVPFKFRRFNQISFRKFKSHWIFNPVVLGNGGGFHYSTSIMNLLDIRTF